jgi:acetylornithine deacetylase/succinyl-diaminopimelate desuccinylase-like protein
MLAVNPGRKVATSQSISWTDIAREATDHLARILAFGAGCPPAGELPAARYLLGVFEREGIPALILPPSMSGSARSLTAQRPNLVAHLPGAGADEPLLLLSHLDGLPRSADEWEIDPIGAGGLPRRAGAMSGPHLAVAHAMALILLARNGMPLRRTVRYAATSEGMGGRAAGLVTLARDHIEHITSDIAIGWGGLSWTARDGRPYSLLANADKGALMLKLRSEGGGGLPGVRTGKDPVERLLKALERLGKLEFPPRPSAPFRAFVSSIAPLFPGAKGLLLNDLLNPDTALKAIETLEQEREIDEGLLVLIKAGIRTEGSIVRLTAEPSDGLRPRVAEADLVYHFPPGEDVETVARQVMGAIGPDGVYLAEKEVLPASESELSAEVSAMARAALAEIDPRANLIVGLTPWTTGLGGFRRCGTCVFGWEQFVSGGSLLETLSARGGGGEWLDSSEYVKEIQAIHSFLCRAAA